MIIILSRKNDKFLYFLSFIVSLQLHIHFYHRAQLTIYSYFKTQNNHAIWNLERRLMSTVIFATKKVIFYLDLRKKIVLYSENRVPVTTLCPCSRFQKAIGSNAFLPSINTELPCLSKFKALFSFNFFCRRNISTS